MAKRKTKSPHMVKREEKQQAEHLKFVAEQQEKQQAELEGESMNLKMQTAEYYPDARAEILPESIFPGETIVSMVICMNDLLVATDVAVYQLRPLPNRTWKATKLIVGR